MKFFSLQSKKSDVENSWFQPSNSFCIPHDYGQVTCLEYGHHFDESILLFTPNNESKKLLSLVDDFLDHEKHVILVKFTNTADVLASFFRIKTSLPLSVFSFQDSDNIVENTLKNIGFSCVHISPKQPSRVG